MFEPRLSRSRAKPNQGWQAYINDALTFQQLHRWREAVGHTSGAHGAHILRMPTMHGPHPVAVPHPKIGANSNVKDEEGDNTRGSRNDEGRARRCFLAPPKHGELPSLIRIEA